MASQVQHVIESPITEERRIPVSFEDLVALPENLHAEWVDGEERDLGEALTAPYGMRVRPGGPWT